MSAVFLFIALSAALILATLGILLWPWGRGSGAEGPDSPGLPKAAAPDAHRSANLDIYRDQWQALARDRDDGLLMPEDFTQAQEDVQRRLLAEMDAANEADAANEMDAPASRLGGRSALALVVAIPLAAALIYAQLGAPQALIPPQLAARQQAQEIDAMLARLVERLKAHPDDTQGWLTLARAYKALGRFAESAEAFEKARARVEGDPALLADHAYARIRAADGAVDARAEALLEAALTLDPQQPQALFMAGLAANDRGDFAAAIARWERLLPLLEPGSDEATMLEDALAKAKAQPGATASAPGRAPARAGKEAGKNADKKRP